MDSFALSQIQIDPLRETTIIKIKNELEKEA